MSFFKGNRLLFFPTCRDPPIYLNLKFVVYECYCHHASSIKLSGIWRSELIEIRLRVGVLATQPKWNQLRHSYIPCSYFKMCCKGSHVGVFLFVALCLVESEVNGSVSYYSMNPNCDRTAIVRQLLRVCTLRSKRNALPYYIQPNPFPQGTSSIHPFLKSENINHFRETWDFDACTTCWFSS